MSIFSALNTAVTGLNAQSNAMSNISDNIANTRTVGYKRVDTNFSTLVTSSDSRYHQSGGVRAAPAFMHDVQGNMQQSQVNSHIAVTGSGFFSVSLPERIDPTNNSVSFRNTNYYTRAGDFTLDKNGFMVNSSGYYLNGWPVDASTGVTNTAATQPIRISQLLDSPVATDNVQYAANLPALVDDGTELPPNSIQIFDAVGNQRTLQFVWTKNGADEWELQIDAPGSTPASFGPVTATFDQGRITALTGGGGVTVPGTQTTGEPMDLGLTLDYGAGIGTQTLNLNLGSFGNSDGTTQFTGSELVLNSFDQNGVPPGSFKSINIDQNGYVKLNYDNGQTKTFFQIPLVQFYNPNGLQRLDGNAFQATPDSGVARSNPPGLGSNGTLVSNAVEAANVEISDEFSKMIVAQRTYSANARVISTSDEILAEVINLRR